MKEVYYEKSEYWTGFNTRGTGFFVKSENEKFLFTARHNIEGNTIEEIGKTLCKLFIPQDPTFLYQETTYNPDHITIIKFSLLAINLDRTDPSNDDLLILKVIQNPPDDQYCFDLQDLNNFSFNDSEEYFLIGYPKEVYEQNIKKNFDLHIVKPIILELASGLIDIKNSKIIYYTGQKQISNYSGFSGGAIAVYNKANNSLKLRAICLSTGSFKENLTFVTGMPLFKYRMISSC